MKRLIAAALTATTMTLAACTATSGTDATPTPGTSTGASPLTSVAPTPTGPTTDHIESWLSGTTTTRTTPTSAPPTGSSTASSSATGTDDPTTAPSTAAGDVYDAIPVAIPATFTGVGLKAANAAIPVWRDAMRVFDESLQDPSGKDWKTAIYRYANDPAAITQTSLIDTFVKQGIHQVGETGYTAEVVGAVEHNVQIKACVDLSKYDVVGADGHSVLKQGTPSRFSRTFSISFYSDHDPATWFLNDIKTPNPVKPC